jgi:hypothetical protein
MGNISRKQKSVDQTNTPVSLSDNQYGTLSVNIFFSVYGIIDLNYSQIFNIYKKINLFLNTYCCYIAN